MSPLIFLHLSPALIPHSESATWEVIFAEGRRRWVIQCFLHPHTSQLLKWSCKKFKVNNFCGVSVSVNWKFQFSTVWERITWLPPGLFSSAPIIFTWFCTLRPSARFSQIDSFYPRPWAYRSPRSKIRAFGILHASFGRVLITFRHIDSGPEEWLIMNSQLSSSPALHQAKGLLCPYEI